MPATSEKESTERRKNAQKASKEADKQMAYAKQRELKRAARREFEISAMKRRVLAYGDAAVLPRSFKVRAAVAKDMKSKIGPVVD